MKIDPKLDLVLERTVDVSVERVWAAWTKPEQLKKWFCPRPWMTTECEIDLRPGGVFHTVMRGPGGEEQSGDSCYLEVVPGKKLVWTTLLGAGFRPNRSYPDVPGFTAIILMEPAGKTGTKYTAIAMHQSPEGAKQHADMGFAQGWGAALDQLVEVAGTF